MNRKHDPYGALRFPDFRLFSIARVLFIMAMYMQSTAIGWELYERTNAPLALGIVGLVQFLPVVLLAIPVGHAADRRNRTHLFSLGIALMACASLGLAVASMFRAPISVEYVCLFVVGVCNTITMVSGGSITGDLVPRELLQNAISWNSSGRQIASVAGPALGGMLIAVSGGAFVVYLTSVALSLIVIVCVMRMTVRPVPRNQEPLSLHSLLAGIRFVHREKLLLSTMTLDLFGVLFGGMTALLPIFARDILDVGPAGLGWLRAAPAVGAGAMAFIVAHMPAMRSAGRAMLLAVAGFGIATILFGLSQNFLLSFAMLVLVGAFDTVSVVVRQTLVQVLPPESMRGRVTSVSAIFISSSNELGHFESGAVAQLFGPVFSVVSGGAGTILVVALVACTWPQLRRLKSLHHPVPADATMTTP